MMSKQTVEEWRECITCGEEYDANDPVEQSIGLYTECYDCSLVKGDVPLKKAMVGFTEEGDFGGLNIMDEDEFEKILEVQEATKGLSKKRG